MTRRGATQRPTSARLDALPRRADRDRADRDRRVLRLHEGHPVHARLPPARGLRVLEQPASRLARAHRRRQRRQESRAVDALQGHGPHRRSRWRSTTRACRSTGRDAQDPPAHLPRGQLLRRPQARARRRLAGGARAAARSARRRPRRRSSSTSCSPRCRPTRAPTCRRCCRQYGAALDVEADGRAGRDARPDRAGARPGAEALNKSYSIRRPDAFKGTALVNSALLGTQPHDLSRMIAAIATLSTKLRAQRARAAGA